MVKLENFGGLTRKQEDLLKKGYPYTTIALFTLNLSQDELTYHARSSKRTTHSGAAVLASGWIQFQKSRFLFKLKRRNDGLTHYTAEWTPQDFIENVKLKGELKTVAEPSVESSVSAEYNHERAKGKITLGPHQQYLKGTVTIGRPELGIGFDGKLDFDSQRLQSYNVAVWCSKKHSKVVLKHEGNNKVDYKLGDFKVSYYQKLGAGHLASLLTMNWETKETVLEVGGDYQYDSSTVLKAKYNSYGRLGAAWIRTLSPTVTFSVAGDVDVNSVSSSQVQDYRFGMHLGFTH